MPMYGNCRYCLQNRLTQPGITSQVGAEGDKRAIATFYVGFGLDYSCDMISTAWGDNESIALPASSVVIDSITKSFWAVS